MSLATRRSHGALPRIRRLGSLDVSGATLLTAINDQTVVHEEVFKPVEPWSPAVTRRPGPRPAFADAGGRGGGQFLDTSLPVLRTGVGKVNAATALAFPFSPADHFPGTSSNSSVTMPVTTPPRRGGTPSRSALRLSRSGRQPTFLR